MLTKSQIGGVEETYRDVPSILWWQTADILSSTYKRFMAKKINTWYSTISDVHPKLEGTIISKCYFQFSAV